MSAHIKPECVEVFHSVKREAMTPDINEEYDTNIRAKSDPGLLSPSYKSQRLVFDGVVVPTLAAVLKRRAEEEENDFKKLALLKNPKLKKDMDLALLPSTLRDRLKPIGLEIQDQYFTLDQATREVVVTRLFMSETYGGNMQMTCPIPSQEFLDVHGMNDFMFLTTGFQPEAPLLPGAPGLCFNTSGDDQCIYKVYRLFVQAVPVSGSKASVYQYMGMYEIRPAVPGYMTVEEYAAHSHQFHNKWAKGILKMSWGLPLCARVLLRKELGREPTYQEVHHAENSRPEQCSKGVPPEEIKMGFLQGTERLYINTMKCVGYDNNFQRQLSEKYAAWKLLPPKPKKRSGAVGKTESSDEKPRAEKLKLEEISKDVLDVKSESGDDLEYVNPAITRSCKREHEAKPRNGTKSDSDCNEKYFNSQHSSLSRKHLRGYGHDQRVKQR